jgi:O-methyltransferase
MDDAIRTCIDSSQNVMMSPVRLLNIYHFLSQVLVFGVEGDVVEFGCHTGRESTTCIRRTMDFCGTAKLFHVYDSFQGLPPSTEGDAGIDPAQWPAGWLKAPSNVLRAHFQSHGLALPVIHEGWVEDLVPRELPAKICFAHVDVDLYHPVKHCLESIYPRLSPRAVVVIDDYRYQPLPGAERAVHEFMAGKPEPVHSLHMPNAFLHPVQAFFRKSA